MDDELELIAVLIDEYVIYGHSLQTIDDDYGFTHGTTSSKLNFYKITGEINANGAYNKGKYNGKYKDKPYLLKRKHGDISEFTVNESWIRKYVYERDDDETLEKFFERVFDEEYKEGETYDEFTSHIFPRYYGNFFQQLKASWKYNAIEARREAEIEMMEHPLKYKIKSYISYTIVIFLVFFMINFFGMRTKITETITNIITPITRKIELAQNKYEYEKAMKENEEVLESLANNKISNDLQPGEFSYNGYRFLGLSLNDMPYKECIGKKDGEIVLGNFSEGKLNGKGLKQKDNVNEIGNFKNDELINGMKLEVIEDVKYVTYILSGKSYDFKIKIEDKDYSILDLEDNTIGHFKDNNWVDNDGNLLIDDRLSKFKLENDKLSFNNDEYFKSSVLYHQNDTINMRLNINSGDCYYDNLVKYKEYDKAGDYKNAKNELGATIELKGSTAEGTFLTDEKEFTRVIRY